MKFFNIIAGIALLVSLVGYAVADVYVQGYYRNNGTYVQPHYRSSPNSSVYDNWSVKPNVNPYTGQPGRINPYSQYNNPYNRQVKPLKNCTLC
jgi:hypothetical protein